MWLTVLGFEVLGFVSATNKLLTFTLSEAILESGKPPPSSWPVHLQCVKGENLPGKKGSVHYQGEGQWIIHTVQ